MNCHQKKTIRTDEDKKTIKSRLNREQWNACECINGPVMVSAGAGSGKTRMLMHRIAYMIIEHNINTITFTM